MIGELQGMNIQHDNDQPLVTGEKEGIGPPKFFHVFGNDFDGMCAHAEGAQQDTG